MEWKDTLLLQKEYHESRMLQAFKNISAVLSKREMDELGWQDVLWNRYRISCYKKQDQWIKMEIFEKEFFGMEGYAAFAEAILRIQNATSF